MDLAFSFDADGRLVCNLIDGFITATATASNLPQAAEDFLSALDALSDREVSECFWHESGGDYRWMFCRRGDRVDVAVMWCAGVITGWQHVFRAEAELPGLLAAAHASLAPSRG